MLMEVTYINKMVEFYGDALVGTQLIHEYNDTTRLYLVYTSDGFIEVVRLFPNYYTNKIELSIDKVLKDIDHTLMPLGDLMGIIETVVNTIKGVD